MPPDLGPSRIPLCGEGPNLFGALARTLNVIN